jgi:hypothetical protein
MYIPQVSNRFSCRLELASKSVVASKYEILSKKKLSEPTAAMLMDYGFEEVSLCCFVKK